MSERRSGRAKKTVNYAKLDGNDDNDDDFEEFKTQPKKKLKVEPVKEKPVKLETKSIKLSQPKSELPNLPRLPLEEKILQRQINEALEISKTESFNKTSSENNKTLDSRIENDEKKEVSIISVEKKETAKENDSTSDETSDEESSSDASADSSSEESSFSEEEEKVKKKNKSSNAAKKNTIVTNEKKFNVIITETAKAVMKNTDVKKDEKLLKTEELNKLKKSPVKVREPVVTVRTNNIKKEKNFSNGNSSPILHTSPVKLSPKGIRLGLSRKVSRKPLHTNVKLQT